MAMKRFLLLTALCALVFNLHAQLNIIPDVSQDKTPAGINLPQQSPVHYDAASTNKSWLSRWYNYGETMELYHGVQSPWYGNFLFPDSTILVNYTSGYGSPWIHKLGDVLDVTSVMFNDATLHPNALTIDATTKYRLDSIHFHCMYDRNIANTSIVDTLLFEISVNDNLLPSYFAPGILSPNFTTDTVYMRRIPYTYLTNGLNLPNKKVIKVPLTAQTYADSLSNGIHIIKVGTDSVPVVNPGKSVVVSVMFIPGYTWVANTDIIDNKNSLLFVARKEKDNFFPHYTKRDFNVSYIIPSDVRYNYAGSWNANYIPSFAYMGTTPTYNYEHHMIYYKISTPYKVTYETQNVSCYGANNGHVNMTVSGGTPPYSFLWSHGATTQNVTALTAGTYTVTITDQASDSTVRIFNITQPAALQAAFSSTPATACGASDGAVLVANISGGTPSYSIIVLDADSVTQTMSDLMAGIYTVKVTDTKGCKLIKPVAVNETGAPAHTADVTQISCFGQADGSIDITITNPGGTPTYAWSNNQTGSDISNLSEGNYMLTVTIGNCHIFGVFDIVEPNPIQVNATVNNPTGGQNNGSIVLQVTGGTAPFIYNWSSGQQTQNIGNLGGGSYTVTITDSRLCTKTETFTVISTGVFEDAQTFNVTLYPNPASDKLFVKAESPDANDVFISIYDYQGKIIASHSFFTSGSTIYSLNLFNFARGFYIAEIICGNRKIYKKFSINR
jgi:hypothetical protein